jgi:hypothetical protein
MRSSPLSSNGNQPQSRVKRFTHLLPYVRALLASLPTGPFVFVVDATNGGRGCMALVVSVLYHQQKRAMPVAWSVVRGGKEHFGEQVHAPLLRQVADLLASLSEPECHRPVIPLGDRELDGTELLTLVRSLGWMFVSRTASNVSVHEEGEEAPFTLSWLPSGLCASVRPSREKETLLWPRYIGASGATRASFNSVCRGSTTA